MREAVIVEAVRTPLGRGKQGGALNGVHAVDLLAHALKAAVERSGIDPVLWPRNAGSYPGYVFTGEPLKLASGHFGLGHGSGAHAPDEYYVIESTNDKVQGFDGAVFSFVEYLYELGK